MIIIYKTNNNFYEKDKFEDIAKLFCGQNYMAAIERAIADGRVKQIVFDSHDYAGMIKEGFRIRAVKAYYDNNKCTLVESKKYIDDNFPME